MKRVICLTSSIVFLSNVEGQYKISKSLDDFNEIEISGACKVNLYQSDSNYIVFHSRDSLGKHFNAQVRGGVLYIASASSYEVHAKKIEAIRTTDASSVASADTLRVDKLTLSAEDAGKIEVMVNAKAIVTHAEDAGTIVLSGNTDFLDAKASDASRIKAYELKALDVKAVSEDGSSEEVWAVNTIDANSSDGSNIHIKGSPQKKNTSASDGGAVKMEDSGEETIPEVGRHSVGAIFNHDSLFGKKHFKHHYGEAFIGFGFVTGGNNDAAVKYGNSREFIMGFGAGYKFCQWNAIGWDIYYKSTDFYLAQNPGKSFPDTMHHSAQKVSLQNFGGLIYDRFTFAQGYHGQLSLDLGFYFDWAFSSREVTWDNNYAVKTIDHGLSYMSPDNYGLTARLLFVRGLSCYFNYRLSDVFKSNLTPFQPTLPACVLGVTIGLGAK